MHYPHINLISGKEESVLMEKQSLPKKAYNAIIDEIVGGALKLGQPVSQTKLTKLLKMSRTPLREALFALEKDGIFTRSGRKYSVCYISRREILELYEIRGHLEDIGIDMCVENLTPELKRSITVMMKKIRKNTFGEDFDPDVLADLNGKLHLMIAHGSQNRYMTKFLREIILKLKIVRVATLNSTERRVEEFEEHSKIIEHIMKKEKELAKAAMREHREHVLKFVKDKVFDTLFYYDE